MLRHVLITVFLVFAIASAEVEELEEVEPEKEVQTKRPETPVVQIVSYSNQQNIDGSYKFEYETADGSKRYEQGYYKDSDGSGDGKTQVVEGSYSYKDVNGDMVSIRYVADENGFRPEGNIIHPAITRYLQNLERNGVEGTTVEPTEEV